MSFELRIDLNDPDAPFAVGIAFDYQPILFGLMLGFFAIVIQIGSAPDDE